MTLRISKKYAKRIIVALSATVLLGFGGLTFYQSVKELEHPVTVKKSNPVKKETPKPEVPILALINQYRGQNGLPALREDATLDASAKVRADEIANCGQMCWTHTRPDGSNFNSAIPSIYSEVGENLAECYDGSNKTVEAWKKSEEHNRNMLGMLGGGDWTIVGIAQAKSNSPKCDITVTHFAR